MEVKAIIQYQDDIRFLERIPSEKRGEYIRNAVTIGLRSIQMGEFTMDGRSYLDPLKDMVDDQGEKIVNLGSKLDSLINIRTNSSRKGRISENICIRALENRYPAVEFHDTAKDSHCGDCCGKFSIGDIMYEFKDYDSAVNSSEISKFHRDLMTTGMKYGVFVSNTSGIAGKRTIEWEIVVQDTIAVYVSQLGFNGLGCIVGTEFLLALQEAMIHDTEKGWLMRHDIQFSGYQERFSECVDEYRSHLEKVSRLGNSLQEAQKKVVSSFEPLHREWLILKLDSESTFRKMVGLREDIQEGKQLAGTEFDAIEFLTRFDNHKTRFLYEMIFRLCDSETSLYLKCSDTNIFGYVGEDLLFKTTSTKTKLTILFLMKEEIVNLNTKYEAIKGDMISIEVKDESPIWELIQKRLSPN